MTTSPTVLPGNLLSVVDSDFETGIGTWVDDTNASGLARSGTNAFTGNYGLSWYATTAADTIVQTGYYPAKANTGYDVSGYMWCPTAGHDVYIGMRWYNSSHSLLSTTWGDDTSATQDVLQPLTAMVTSPANAAYFKMVVWASTSVAANEYFYLDLMYATNPPACLWIDWYNPAFESSSMAGNSFADMTPWVRFDQNISLSRGRQDAISEISTGSASFYLQNDTGWFTPQTSNSPYFGYISLGARTQVNTPDEDGNWVTRFDGPVSQITYAVDVTGGTNLANVSCADILAALNRQDVTQCWTEETVMSNGPWLHWTLNDAGADGAALETSGNNGPVLRATSYVTGAGTAGILWQNSNGGVETLADAAAPGQPDGSSGFTAGQIEPIVYLRGLDAGVTGPYSTPLASVNFTPITTAQSGQNYFAGTDGYQLNGELYFGSTPEFMDTTNDSYSVECWFMMNSAIGGNLTEDYGPYTVFSLGSGRQLSCIVVGLFLNSPNLEIGAKTYGEPPAYPVLASNTAPTVLESVTATMTADTQPLPHHLVLTISASTAYLYLDGKSIGSLSLPAGQIYDTICVGGAFGGHGNFYGNISVVSIYQFVLSQAQITADAVVGQYGYWEQTADNAIAALGNIANLPTFWNNLSGGYNGLSLMEYYDITNATPLSSMQEYEDAEQGTLFINASGQLTFHTRDWRMGYGGPDLTLPADSYSADLGYELIDTYLINEAAFSTTVFTAGTSGVNSTSQNTYGSYADGTAFSPIQFPMITWSRAFSYYGLSQYQFNPDPNLTDETQWIINSRNTPELVCGQLTIDVLTPDPGWGITLSEILGLDIDNLVTLVGMPESFPDQTGALDYFIEGVNETIGTGVHTISFYTSPASSQRAWKPGDSIYGVLGSTSRIGISAADISTPPALGKDVAHDSGPPYWPPTFAPVISASQVGFSNPNTESPTITPTISTQQGACLLVQILAAASTTISVADTQSNSYSQIGSVTFNSKKQYLFAAFDTSPVSTGDTITITTTTSQQYVCSLYFINNVTAVDAAAVTATGDNTSPAVTGGSMNQPGDLELIIVANDDTATVSIPSGWNQLEYNYEGTYANQLFYRIASGTTADAFSATLSASTYWGAIAISFTPATVLSLNNPANNGHDFIGGLEIRGLRDNLAMKLNPPLLVVGQKGTTESFTSLIPARVAWDTVFIDTVGGMGIIPNWPNWYCVTVPGMYEISGSLVWSYQSSGAAGVRTGWIIVAQQAAQLLALGTGSPTSGDKYSIPIAETVTPNNNSTPPICNPSTRVYLGVGDMVSLGGIQTQGSAITSSAEFNGSLLSLRWLGWGTMADNYPIADWPGGGNAIPTPTATNTYTKTFSATGSYSYHGSTDGATLRATNGDIWQGKATGTTTGSQFGFATFNYTAIADALSGATINSVKLKMTNLHTWYSTGAYLMVGYTTYSGAYGSTFTPGSGTHFNQLIIPFKEGETLTVDITGYDIGTAFQSGGATALAFGNDSTTLLDYYGYWSGDTNPELIFNYTVS